MIPALNDDFMDMLSALIDARVEFVVVGAHALAAHGLPRATGDIDILVRPSEENAKRIVSALIDFGAPIAAHGVKESDFTKKGIVYQLGLPPRRIDLLTEITGVSFDEAIQSSIRAHIDSLEIPFLGIEALIANKRAAGRDKDLVDVRVLEKSKKRD